MNGEVIVGPDMAAGKNRVPPSFDAAGDGGNVFIAQINFSARGWHD